MEGAEVPLLPTTQEEVVAEVLLGSTTQEEVVAEALAMSTGNVRSASEIATYLLLPERCGCFSWRMDASQASKSEHASARQPDA